LETAEADLKDDLKDDGEVDGSAGWDSDDAKAGLDPSDPAEFEAVFMRPFTAQLLKFILACVGLGMVLVGSLVLAILLLALGG